MVRGDMANGTRGMLGKALAALAAAICELAESIRLSTIPRTALNRRETAYSLGICVRSVDDLRSRSLLVPSVGLGEPRWDIRELHRYLDRTRAVPLPKAGR